MALKIRLTRGGAKKRPYYRIVVADARAPRDGRFIDKVGAYDPMKAKDDPARIVLDNEKIQGWLAKGAQPTDRVLRLLDSLGLAKREEQIQNVMEATVGMYGELQGISGRSLAELDGVDWMLGDGKH